MILTMLLAVTARADFVFIHTTDTHVTAADKEGSNAQMVAAMYREIAALRPRPAFVLNTGDFVEAGTPPEYAMHAKILPLLGLPHYGAPGNHDVRWNPLGKEGFEKGVGPLFQSWDHQNVHFVTLDSTVLLQHWGHFDQHVLDWLRADLEKVGSEKPIVIGFHHPIGRESVQVDNEQALLDVVAPYNVRLWLTGHGHGDLLWNINGAPALMAKGLYQGSYHIIEVTRDELRVKRRSLAKAPTKQEPGVEAALPEATPVRVSDVIVVPLAKQSSPTWLARATPDGDTISAEVARGDLPPDATVTMAVNSSKPAPMQGIADGWLGRYDAKGLLPGRHRVSVHATLADGRSYRKVCLIDHQPAGAIKPLWETDLRAAVQSRLVRSGDWLYVTTMGGHVYCINPADGGVKWRFDAGGAVFSNPCIADGAVFFGSSDHHAYAVDSTTGKPRWKIRTGGGVFSGAAVAQGIVCIASVDMKIYGLDAATGAIRWTAPCQGMIQSQVATDGKRFFVGGWDNQFRCLDPLTGREIWANKFGKLFYYAPAIASPAIGFDKVFVTSNDGVFHAQNIETGKVEWEFDGKKVGYSSPLFRDGRVYVAIGDEGRVFCFDAETGKQLWVNTTDSVIYDSSFAFGGGNVFIGSVNGTISAFGASDGRLQWQYALGPGHLLASPAADNQRVYISSMSGRLIALPTFPGSNRAAGSIQADNLTGSSRRAIAFDGSSRQDYL